jgi:hypothetical protein
VFTDARDNTLDGMYLPIEKAELVLKLLLEGSSVSTVERITEVHHTTILKLLVLAGEGCERIMAQITDGFAPYKSAITTTLHDRLTSRN